MGCMHTLNLVFLLVDTFLNSLVSITSLSQSRYPSLEYCPILQWIHWVMLLYHKYSSHNVELSLKELEWGDFRRGKKGWKRGNIDYFWTSFSIYWFNTRYTVLMKSHLFGSAFSLVPACLFCSVELFVCYFPVGSSCLRFYMVSIVSSLRSAGFLCLSISSGSTIK